MAIKLNLLPPEYGSLGGLGKILNATRALGVIAMALFFVFAIGVSAFFIISQITLNGLNSDIDSLKGQVGAEQTSEQQIVLLKDRISKIKTVIATPDSTKNLTSISPLILGLPPSASLKSLALDSSKIDISLSIATNSDLSSFLGNITGAKDLGSVVMHSLTLGPAGYQMDLTINRK